MTIKDKNQKPNYGEMALNMGKNRSLRSIYLFSDLDLEPQIPI